MNLIKITRYTSQNNSNNKKLDPQQERNTNEQSTSRTERTTNPINKTGINQRNVTNNHDQHTDKNNFNSNIKCNKNQKKKRTRRSNKQKTSKILNIIYSNARGIKSKTKSIKKILFETRCDIFAITETNLKDKEKVNINGDTWAGKNRASEGGGIGFLIINKIKTAITIEQQENTRTEIMWIRIQLKRKETCLLNYFMGNKKAEIITLHQTKNLKSLERHLYQYIANNQNHILLLGDFNAKIGNGEQGIPNGDPHNNTKWEKIDKSNQ